MKDIVGDLHHTTVDCNSCCVVIYENHGHLIDGKEWKFGMIVSQD